MAKICEHNRFKVNSSVIKLKEHKDSEAILGYMLEATVVCEECNSIFRFKGLPIGFRPDKPAASTNGTELRAPIEIIL